MFARFLILKSWRLFSFCQEKLEKLKNRWKRENCSQSCSSTLDAWRGQRVFPSGEGWGENIDDPAEGLLGGGRAATPGLPCAFEGAGNLGSLARPECTESARNLAGAVFRGWRSSRCRIVTFLFPRVTF